MTCTITLRDAALDGKILSELPVSFSAERITVADLITTRVYAEVEKYNTTLPEYFRGLVQPKDAEKVLNGYKLKKGKMVDAEKQAYLALDSFQKNAFFILINDRQAADLQEEVLLTKDTTVSFVKLTPLVGG
jgi:hypothetical protein